MGGTQKIRDSMNSVVVENSIPFRRHNSCVDFTFLPELFATNSHKLSRLNSVFERAADKRLGGIREDKLARILPSCSSSSKDKYEFLFPTSSTSLFTSKDSKKSNTNVEVRVVSRGPFLAMFAHESVSFLNTLAQNEKTEREKHRRRMKAKKKQKKKAEQRQPYAQQEDGSVNRQRAHSLPSPPASVENKQQQSALADFGFSSSSSDKKKPMSQSRNPETEKEKQPERISMTTSNTTKQSKKSKREKKEKKKSKNKSRDGSKKTSSVGKLTKSIRKKYFADCTNSQNTVANTDVPPEDYNKANSSIKSELTAVGYENMTASESSYSSHSTQGGHYGDNREQEEPRIIHHYNTMPDSQDLHHYQQQHHYSPSDVYSSPSSSSINQISSIDIGTYPFPQHAAQVPLSEFKDMSMPSSNSNGTPMDEINCISYSYSSSSESEIGNDNKRSHNSRSSRRSRNHTNTTTTVATSAPFWQQQKHTTYEDYLKKLNCGKHNKAAYSDEEEEDEMENDSNKMECVLLHNVVSFFEKLFPQSQQRRTAAVVDISPTSSSFSSSLRRRRRNDFFDPNPQQTILYYTESTTSESSSSYPPSNEMMMKNDHTRSSSLSISQSNRNRRQQQHGSSSRQRQRQRREKRSQQTYNFPQNLTTMRAPGTTGISSMRSNTRA